MNASLRFALRSLSTPSRPPTFAPLSRPSSHTLTHAITWGLFIGAVFFLTGPLAIAQPCETPPPLPTLESPSPWNHKTTALTVIKQGKPKHRIRDTISPPDQHVWLIGKFTYGPFRKDLKGEKVDVFLQRRRSCEQWSPMGSALTSREKEHGTIDRVQDDGGRIFVQVEPQPVGPHRIQMRVRGDASLAHGTLYIIEKDTPIVVFDIDGTLTESNKELASDLFGELTDGAYTPRLHPHVLAMVQTWVKKGALPIYLTGRPDFLHRLTLEWLEDEGFPPGPVILADGISQAKPTKKSVGRYKLRSLQFLRETIGAQIVAAYGNSKTDIYAYTQAELPADRIFIFGKHGKKAPEIRHLSDTDAHLRWIESIPFYRSRAIAPTDW